MNVYNLLCTFYIKGVILHPKTNRSHIDLKQKCNKTSNDTSLYLMFFPGRWSHLVSLALLAQHTKGQKTITQYLYIHDKNTTQANTTQTRHKHKIKHKTNLSVARAAMTLLLAIFTTVGAWAADFTSTEVPGKDFSFSTCERGIYTACNAGNEDSADTDALQ